MKKILLLLFLSVNIFAAEIIEYDCTFSKFNDKENFNKSTKDFDLKFTFDKTNKEAFFVGKNGINEVLPIEGYMGITFLEILPTGAVQSTTVENKGDAVHSRNSILFNSIIPSQFFGKCAINKK